MGVLIHFWESGKSYHLNLCLKDDRISTWCGHRQRLPQSQEKSIWRSQQVFPLGWKHECGEEDGKGNWRQSSWFLESQQRGALYLWLMVNYWWLPIEEQSGLRFKMMTLTRCTKRIRGGRDWKHHVIQALWQGWMGEETEAQWSEMTYLRSHGWLVADLESNPFTDF